MLTMIIAGLAVFVVLQVVFLYLVWEAGYKRGWQEREGVKISPVTVERLRKWEIT